MLRGGDDAAGFLSNLGLDPRFVILALFFNLSAHRGDLLIQFCELRLYRTQALIRISGELARRLVAMRPEMKVIFMSGYDSDAVSKHGVLEPGTDYLEKPFSVEILMRKVREILSRK